MSPSVQTVADTLLQAYRQQRPVDAAPLERLLHGPDDAYAAQEAVARASDWFPDAVPLHWKSGGAARPAVLTHAPLPPRHVWPSPADASRTHFNLRLIEAEVALRLGRDVTPADAQALSHEAAPDLVDAMAVSIEIVVRAGSRRAMPARCSSWPTCSRTARWCWASGSRSPRAIGPGRPAWSASATWRPSPSGARIRWAIPPGWCRSGCGT